MSKKNIAIIFGGASSEHEVSRRSASCIIENINREKYNVILIGITKSGKWYLCNGNIKSIINGSWENRHDNLPAFISPDTSTQGIIVLKDDNYSIIKVDAVIPVLHGKNGEDGTIQGLLQLAKIPFVGCDLLSSATCMDKIDTNIILTHCGIQKAKFTYTTAFDFNKDKELCIEAIETNIGNYPMFVKPSSAGSSVGVSKANNRSELIDAIKIAIKEDSRVLIEENIEGQEVECAILGNDNPISSIVGEIAPSNEFYDYEAKYQSENSKLYIPAHIDSQVSKNLREIAIKAYKAMGCSGLSRVDFFIQKETNNILLNEINTFPGFTSISMYPKLFGASGIDCTTLIDNLINLALERTL